MHTFLWLVIQGFLVSYAYGWYWGSWEDLKRGRCSKTCGTGVQSIRRRRYCYSDSDKVKLIPGGCQKLPASKMTSTAHCNEFVCPRRVEGGWTRWRSPIYNGECSITCGSGRGTVGVTYYRFCTNPVPKYGGRPCAGKRNKYLIEECVVRRPCSLDGGWSSWTRAKRQRLCSVTCGSGKGIILTYYERSCTNPVTIDGGKQCEGNSTKFTSEECVVTQPCPIDGGWGDWIKDSEGECSVTCGSGTKHFSSTRICDNPKPSSGGQPCVGNSSVTSTVNCDTGTSCEDLLSDSDTEIASPQESSDNITGAIVGLLAGLVIAACLVTFGLYVFSRKSKRDKPDTIVLTVKKDNYKTKNLRQVTTHDNPAFVPDKPNDVK